MLAGTWFAGRQGIWQAHALQADRVAGRHMHRMQTRLQAGIWTAGRQGVKKAVADKRPARRHSSKTAGRQVSMPAHRLRGNRVAGRHSDLQADRPAGQALELQVGTVADGRQTGTTAANQTR